MLFDDRRSTKSPATFCTLYNCARCSHMHKVGYAGCRINISRYRPINVLMRSRGASAAHCTGPQSDGHFQTLARRP